MVLEFVDEVWNHRRLNRVTDFMVRDLVLQTVGDTTVIRPDGYQRDLLDLVAPFPDATFAVRDVQTNYAERYAGLRDRGALADEGHLPRRRHVRAPHPPARRPHGRLPVPRPGRRASCARSACTTRSGLRAQINNTRGDGRVDSNANIY